KHSEANEKNSIRAILLKRPEFIPFDPLFYNKGRLKSITEVKFSLKEKLNRQSSLFDTLNELPIVKLLSLTSKVASIASATLIGAGYISYSIPGALYYAALTSAALTPIYFLKNITN
ncbi:hypothetical protein N9Y92_04740, partial [Chlamydiales bacterium]|nr:hypothetical protein [Chlamydiales bacterium]